MKIIAVITLSLFSYFSNANNLQIGVPSVNLNNELVFTVSWDNSWNTSSAPNNWDGVYLFIKYRDCASTGEWQHADLSTTLADHFAGSPLEIDNYLLSDGKGVIVKRSTVGVGNISSVTVRLRMQAPIATSVVYDFKVFGIEMVYIPTGSFYLGDGSSARRFTDGNSGAPLLINNDGALARGVAPGLIYSILPSSVPSSIPAAFPLGYDSVYVMKYEITQGQWLNFLNTLNSAQASYHFLAQNSNRLNFAGTWPNYTSNFPHRGAVKYTWYGFSAFLDWAALRPMTETEFEKICRGPSSPVPGEYAWGTSLNENVISVLDDGTPTERNANTAPPGFGKSNFAGAGFGPMRSGFAATPTTNRAQSGATYYGVMEMSGNASEFAIGVYYASGLNFNGTHGDGYLGGTNNYFANVNSWPSPSSGSTGMRLCGGSYISSIFQETSNRYKYFSVSAGATSIAHGGRGIR